MGKNTPDRVPGGIMAPALEIALNSYLDDGSQAIGSLCGLVETNREVNQEFGVVPGGCFGNHDDRKGTL